MKEDIKPLATLILFTGIFFGSLVVIFNTNLLDFKHPRTETPTQVEPEIEPDVIKAEIKKEASSFEGFFNLDRRITLYPEGVVTSENLIKACENPAGRGVADRSACNKEIARITKVIEIDQKPTKGWLYIKAGVARAGASFTALNREYDAIWFFLDEKDGSGHLFVPDAVASRVSEDGLTEILFPLEKVSFVSLPYSENEPSNRRVINLIDRLTADKHYIAAFVSSLGNGKIFSLELGFQE